MPRAQIQYELERVDVASGTFSHYHLPFSRVKDQGVDVAFLDTTYTEASSKHPVTWHAGR